MEKTAALSSRVNPFSSDLSKAPDMINIDLMTTRELHEKLQKGYDDIEAGNVQNAKGAFEKFLGES